MCVGLPLAAPTAWAEVVKVDESTVTLRDLQTVPLAEVLAYLVAYPSGTLVDLRSAPGLALPEWVRDSEDAAFPDRDELTPADLKVGQDLVRVTFGRSTSRPDSLDHYSTTLRNDSGTRVRVLKFGGYSKMGKGFTLHTVTKQFFTADEFKEWYDQQGNWIEPGQSVTDPNNYGSRPCLWAFYCETERGKRFLTGSVIE